MRASGFGFRVTVWVARFRVQGLGIGLRIQGSELYLYLKFKPKAFRVLDREVLFLDLFRVL